MKKLFLLSMCLIFVFVSTGCQSTKTRAVEGAAVGGVVGATAGAIIGHQSRHGGQGAALGAVLGALAGGAVGAQIEKPDNSVQSASAAPGVNPSQLSIQQIIDFTNQGVSEDAIIDKIHITNSRFNLDANDINYLKQKGVSQKVIDAMR